MELKIENECTGKVFQKTLVDISVDNFYDIDCDTLDRFIEEMEDKYNSTMDFTGGDDFIKYTIYELYDESFFEKILDEWSNFIANNVR